MKISTRLTGLLTVAALAASPMAMAEMNRTESTIVGAAVGGVAGSMLGNNLESTLLGAAAGGLLGNLLAQNNDNYTREGYYNNRYYYGGREFRNRKDYEAYREAVERDMLRDKEARRYANYRDYRREHAGKRNNNNRYYIGHGGRDGARQQARYDNRRGAQQHARYDDRRGGGRGHGRH